MSFIENNSGIFSDPFLMMVSTPACHSPWDSAPQYAKDYQNETAPQTPSYNVYGKVNYSCFSKYDVQLFLPDKGKA